MSTIQRKPPIKARNYQRKIDNIHSETSAIGIEEVSTPDLFLSSVNTSVSTFDGFFGEKPNQLSLTYELCSAYSNLFINTSQYLWGPKSSASLLKTIQELMALREFEDSQGENHQDDSENNGEENQENEAKKDKKNIKLSKKTQVLQKAGEELYKELENRETIHNNMLIGNLLGMVSS
jgi:hypothetical protein